MQAASLCFTNLVLNTFATGRFQRRLSFFWVRAFLLVTTMSKFNTRKNGVVQSGMSATLVNSRYLNPFTYSLGATNSGQKCVNQVHTGNN